MEVPEGLRHKFKYSLANQVNGYPGDVFISIEEPTAKLAGKTLALSFKPASKADEDIIASRLLAPGADGQIDPSLLPKTLPGYLINLIAEFTIDGQTVAQGAAGTMGGELHEEMGLFSPKEGWETSVNKPAAGEYRAIGLDLQGSNIAQAARLKQRLEQTNSKLEVANAAQLATLTKHNSIGEILYSTELNYFAMNDLQDQIAAKSTNILSYRLPSYGVFSTSLSTQYWYGLPRNVGFGGLNMDIDHLKQHRVSKTGNMSEELVFSQNIGPRMSAMEHLVPEQMFSTETDKALGISAIKALTIASRQGQKIWTITASNLDLALTKINLGEDASMDIRNAVSSGKVVTAHEGKINFNGWFGEGYTMIDPLTGSGAYIIAGGRNGGQLVNSDNLLISSSIILGMTDASLRDEIPSTLPGKPWWNTNLIRAWFAAKVSTAAGYLGLFVATALVLNNGELSTSNKFAQIMMNMLAFYITSYMVGAVMGAALLAGGLFVCLGIVAAIGIAIALAVAATYINLIYFTTIIYSPLRRRTFV